MKRSLQVYDRPPLDPQRPTGLILCGMGGPDGPAAVEPFLRNLFRDPEIFPLPKMIAGVVGSWIARRRAPKVRRDYAELSSDSATTQLETTREQSDVWAQLLSAGGQKVLPGVAMRYWHPYPAQTVPELVANGAEQFVVVPMYPQFSWTTNGSTIDFVLESVAANFPVQVIADWHLLSGYLDALSRPVIATLSAWASEGRDPAVCAVVYVAHSLPESFVKKGDPYADRTRATVGAVHKLVTKTLSEAGHGQWLKQLVCGGSKSHLAFQSKVGPIKWLGPEAVNEARRLGQTGTKNLCLQPVSFTCEHIETRLELDVQLRAIATAAGITEFQRGAALNLDSIWLEDLARLISRTAFAHKSEAVDGNA